MENQSKKVTVVYHSMFLGAKTYQWISFPFIFCFQFLLVSIFIKMDNYESTSAQYVFISSHVFTFTVPDLGLLKFPNETF